MLSFFEFNLFNRSWCRIVSKFLDQSNTSILNALKALPALLRNGFKHLLHLALRLEEDGLATCGLPCTSYIFINAGTHKRSSATPYGAEELQYIKDANLFLVTPI